MIPARLPKMDKEKGIVYFFCSPDLACEDCCSSCPLAGAREPYDCPDCDAKKSMHYIGDGDYRCEECGYWE